MTAVADDRQAMDELNAALIAAYTAAGVEIAAALTALADIPAGSSRRRRARQIERRVQVLRRELDTKAQRWAIREFKTIYNLGASAAASTIGKTLRLDAPHKVAAETAASDTLDYLLSATKHMSSDAKRVVRASVRTETAYKIASGRTAVDSGRELKKELARRSIVAVVFKNGAKHTIDDYAAMVIRTQTALAYNQAAFVVAKEERIEYMVCQDGPGCGLISHASGGEANGQIMTVAEAQQYSLGHPRCRRTWGLVPGVTSRKDAKALQSAGTLKSTEAQDRDIRTADESRRTDRARIAARRKRLERRRQRNAA